jgi:hypothetical protein
VRRRRGRARVSRLAPAERPAGLAFALDGLEASRGRVVAAVDDAGELPAGELSARAERDVAAGTRMEDVRRLVTDAGGVRADRPGYGWQPPSIASSPITIPILPPDWTSQTAVLGVNDTSVASSGLS